MDALQRMLKILLGNRRTHQEKHRTGQAGWLRAAVLGADDGLVSVSSLMVGVLASGAGTTAVFTAGLAGLVAGAMSMAAGEYVSVSAQADIQQADRDREQREQRDDPEGELRELTGIYESRGLPPELAEKVAVALHAAGPLAAHLRDEVGQNPETRAHPVQAAGASAVSFLSGGLVPFLGLLFPVSSDRLKLIVAVTLAGLAISGMLSAKISGTPPLRPALRVLSGGAAAMLITFGAGFLVHVMF